ncbi:SET domain-containing protein [Agrocybe pediades]|nr:SET domain-containing protein [Agrocybe pediades]
MANISGREVTKSYTKPTTPDDDEDLVTVATIPNVVVEGESHPQQHSEWIVSEQVTKQKVFKAPGYPKPVPKPFDGDLPVYEIKATPDMGLGLFATRSFSAGDFIFAERPLLVLPLGMINLYDEVPAEASNRSGDLTYSHPATAGPFNLGDAEVLIELAVSKMNPDVSRAFHSLDNCHSPNDYSQMIWIALTNALRIMNLYDGPTYRAYLNSYAGISEIGSRINHSCKPNVYFTFDLASFSFSFKALRDIASGEQLFRSYCSIHAGRAQRRKELADWNITCRCASCANINTDSDGLRLGYDKIIFNAIGIVTNSCRMNQAAMQSSFEYLAQLRQELYDEGLYTSKLYPSLLRIMRALCMKMESVDKAKEIEEEMKKYDKINDDLCAE